MEAKDIKPNKGYLTAIFFLIAVMLFLVYTVWDNRQEIDDLERREARLVEERDTLRGLLDELHDRYEDVEPIETEIDDADRSFLSNFELNRLRRQGLDDPINDLTRDLLSRDDIIPYEGVLGGTMSFYTPQNIHVISPRWVFAYFEDGHIRGEMLLEYSIDNYGNISWNVIDSYLDR